MAFSDLKKTIIDRDLCTRCGTCVAVCPEGFISFSDVLGDCLPEAVANHSCGTCDSPCLRYCPGEDVNFPDLNEWIFGRQPEDYLLGHAPYIATGYATDAYIRSHASSGGVITALLGHLLEKGNIAAVACLVDDPDAPLMPVPRVNTEPEHLLQSQQSKYSLAPVNSILRDSSAVVGDVAIVALPDQVHAIRKMQLDDHPMTQNIKLLIGSFCGVNHHFTSVRQFLQKHGVKNLDLVQEIKYRAGAWPGHFRVTLKDGRKLEMGKFYANYMSAFYNVERSLACIDLSNELADISAADAWAPRYEDRHEGFSLIFGRTAAGRNAISEAEISGVVHLEATTRSDAFEMHAHGLFNKKMAVWSRMKAREFQGKGNPRYGYRVRVPLRIQVVGFIVSSLLSLGRTKIGQSAIQMFPLNLTGVIFLWIRKIWRKLAMPKNGKSFVNKFEVIKE